MRAGQFFIAVALVTSFVATGCAKKEYHYWQKSDPNVATYLYGVKAQQHLEQDISECVHEVIELTKLADVRMETPAPFQPLDDYDQKQATQGMVRLPAWDTPEYLKDVRVDHSDYHDFEGCMQDKGWARVKYVAPDTEMRAKQVYDLTAQYSVRPDRTAQERRYQEGDDIYAEK